MTFRRIDREKSYFFSYKEGNQGKRNIVLLLCPACYQHPATDFVTETTRRSLFIFSQTGNRKGKGSPEAEFKQGYMKTRTIKS